MRKLTRRAVTLAALLLALWPAMPLPAGAQNAAPDPRLAAPTITVLQSLLALREAEMRALAEDLRKADEAHQATWAEWYRAREAEARSPR